MGFSIFVPMIADFVQTLQAQLRERLPGSIAQQKMSPSVRFSGKGFPEKKYMARNSGVLILLYPKKNNINTVLIERNIYKGVHSGQISLPGGKYEKSDINLIATALREAEEEIGINSTKVEVLGKLTPLYVPVSNFQIMPIVGFVSSEPNFKPDPIEVNALIEVKLSDLFDPAKSKVENLFRDNYNIVSPYFEVGKHHVWGATAMILSEFREVLYQAKLLTD